MRIAALYDIHGNLPALEAVLQEVDRSDVDQIVIGGDVVPGPMSKECIDRLQKIDLPIQYIRGNCETAVLAQLTNNPIEITSESVLEDLRWTAEVLLPSQIEFLSKWPGTINLELQQLGKVLFCHATPDSETAIFTRVTPEEKLLPVFEKLNVDIVVCGHTHMQFDRNIGKIRVINAGSVGMSYGKPGAYWLLLGSDIELRHTDYDLTNAAKLILKTSYPHAKDFAENNVLHPPSEEVMIEILKSAEIK